MDASGSRPTTHTWSANGVSEMNCCNCGRYRPGYFSIVALSGPGVGVPDIDSHLGSFGHELIKHAVMNSKLVDGMHEVVERDIQDLDQVLAAR